MVWGYKYICLDTWFDSAKSSACVYILKTNTLTPQTLEIKHLPTYRHLCKNQQTRVLLFIFMSLVRRKWHKWASAYVLNFTWIIQLTSLLTFMCIKLSTQIFARWGPLWLAFIWIHLYLTFKCWYICTSALRKFISKGSDAHWFTTLRSMF